MELGRYLTVRRRQAVNHHHGDSPREDHLERKRLPLIESPVNDQLYDVLDSDGTPNLEKLRSRASVLPAISSTDGPILYKTRHEASTIELFYDLFFVANLATFTAAHKHSDAECKSVPGRQNFFLTDQLCQLLRLISATSPYYGSHGSTPHYTTFASVPTPSSSVLSNSCISVL